MMESLRVFIVEDDKLYGEMLRYHLALNPDNEVLSFTTGKECIDNLYKDPDFIYKVIKTLKLSHYIKILDYSSLFRNSHILTQLVITDWKNNSNRTSDLIVKLILLQCFRCGSIRIKDAP